MSIRTDFTEQEFQTGCRCCAMCTCTLVIIRMLISQSFFSAPEREDQNCSSYLLASQSLLIFKVSFIKPLYYIFKLLYLWIKIVSHFLKKMRNLLRHGISIQHVLLVAHVHVPELVFVRAVSFAVFNKRFILQPKSKATIRHA